MCRHISVKDGCTGKKTIGIIFSYATDRSFIIIQATGFY